MKILQCVPNFSEGRNPNFLKELELVLKKFPVKSSGKGIFRSPNKCLIRWLPAQGNEVGRICCAAPNDRVRAMDAEKADVEK